MSDLQVGDRFWRQYGPFVTIVEVTEVTERGAVLAIVPGIVTFAGFENETVAPDRIVLADREHDFLGRAHWHTVDAWTPDPDHFRPLREGGTEWRTP